jgi:hypothetical protein
MNSQQKLIVQKMTPEQKLKVFLSLYNSARKLKAAGLRHQYPLWSEEQINKKVKELFLCVRT